MALTHLIGNLKKANEANEARYAKNGEKPQVYTACIPHQKLPFLFPARRKRVGPKSGPPAHLASASTSCLRFRASGEFRTAYEACDDLVGLQMIQLTRVAI